ncbi:MFS transporter [Actinocorallia sp. API 0066]|uniref:MFS transporter n=1 Tax=Actinocorallia sp. API 0066 TaxID=2896846 RepID=UPI001E4091B0|nr:MFS transporter [Actinocorallia sp. API 0066]MCD0452138.1 MFS transporter [Actinocorallia sp. API 0066]
MHDLSLFGDRRFLILFIARTCSVMGSAFGPVALAFGVLDLPGATASTLAVVLTAQAVPEIALMLFGGVIADRLPRHLLMTGAELVSALAFGVMAVLFLTGTASTAALVVCAVFVGVSFALFYPALVGIVPEVVPPDRLQTANALLRLGMNGARLLGVAAAGAMIALVGSGWALAVNAAAFVLSAVLLVTLRLPRDRDAGPSGSMLVDLRQGWREFSSRRWLWAGVLHFSLVFAAMQAAFAVLGPVVAKADLGGAPAWSAVLTGQTVGTLLGAVVAIRIRPRRPLLVAVPMIFGVALPMFLLGFGAPLIAVVLGGFVMGIAFNVFGVLFETTMQREVPADALSRVSAYDALGSFLFGPLGLIAAGPLAARFGERPALLLCGCLVSAATLLTLLVPDVRRIRARTGGGLLPEPAPGG